MRGSGTTAYVELNLTDRIACLWAAFSCWSLSVLFFIGWWWTSRVDGGAWVGVPAGALMVELFLLFSGLLTINALTASTPFGAVAGGLLVASLYGGIIAGFALSFESWWILGYGLAEVAGRVVGMVRRSEFEVAMARERLRIGFIIFLALGFLILTLAPPLPRGGITGELTAKFCPGTGGRCGMTVPLQNVHAFMVVYFFLLGMVEFLPLLARPRARR